MINLERNYENVFNDMINFTANYIKTNKLQSAIIGISGGIDSTIVAALLYETKNQLYLDGYENFNVLGYSLPTKTTDDKEYLVSTFVGNAFTSEFETFNIDVISTQLFNAFDVVNHAIALDDNYRFRKGNVKSRLRMMFLYDAAKYHHGFVVGTDNYTEKLLGFSTIGGDALADYMPLQYLWKTEIYEIANYLLNKYKTQENWGAVNAINESIKLIPQDGLGISTSDMDQIGANNYFDVDEILYEYETLNQTFDKFVFSDEYKRLVDRFGQQAVGAVLHRRINNFKLKLPLEFKYSY